MMPDEHHPADCWQRDTDCYQFRCTLDRRFWVTSGGWRDWISVGVIDNYGTIVSTEFRDFPDHEII